MKQKKKNNTDRHGESGIALILVAVAVVFIGVFVSLGLGVFDVREEHDREDITRQKAERLINHLASFVQEYGRLPCPAAPSVAPNTSGFGAENRPAPGTQCNAFEGVVPFRALGLQKRDVLDGWTRFFTYRISPVFTNLDGVPDTDIVGSVPVPGAVPVYDMCRSSNLWVGTGNRTLPGTAGGTQGGTNRNLNPRKAKFCCPVGGQAQDIQITGAANNPLTRNTVAYRGAIDTPKSPSGIAGNLVGAFPPVFSSTAFAVVILSHGRNGLGAFIVGTTNRIPGAANNELENANGDRNFVDAPRIQVNGPNYFDDIIVYRTNTALYAELNSGTCIRPFR